MKDIIAGTFDILALLVKGVFWACVAILCLISVCVGIVMLAWLACILGLLWLEKQLSKRGYQPRKVK